MANRFLNNIKINDSYTLPPADGTANQIIQTNGAGELSFIDPSAISVGESEQVHIACKNTSGVAISKGDPVYITGTVGTSFIIQIAKADASDSAKMPAVGLAETDLGLNAEGFVIVSGVLKNLTTDPLSTSDGTPSSNDTVYVKAGGGLTKTKPTGSGNFIQNVGKVGRVNSANAGSLAVSTIMRTNDVPNLTTGKIWVGSSTYTTESTVVHLDETNGRMGIGTTSPSSTLQVGGGSVDSSFRTYYNDNTYAELRGYGINFNRQYSYLRPTNDNSNFLYIGSQPNTWNELHLHSNTITFSDNTSEVMRINPGGNVGIGTSSPGEKLDVVGRTRVNQNGEAFYLVGTDHVYSAWYPRGTSNGRKAYMGYGGASTTDFTVMNEDNGAFVIGTNNAERMRIISTGNVGIGTTSPGYALSVNGDVQSDFFRSYQYPTSSFLDFDDDTTPGSNGTALVSVSSMKFIADSNNNGTTDAFSWIVDGLPGAGSTLMTLTDEGNVGIGTTSPQEELHITSTVPVIRLEDTDGGYAQIVGSNGSLSLRSDQANTVASSIIDFIIDNSEKMRIDSSGNVGIGTPSPSQKLEVSGNVIIGGGTLDNPQSWGKILQVQNTGSNGAGISVKDSNKEFNISTYDNKFYISEGVDERITITSTGDVGIGTTNPSQKLQVNGIGEFAGALRITEASTSQNILIGNQDSGGTNTPAMINGVNGSLRFGKGNSWSGEGGTFTETMRVSSSGTVGIGTTSPNNTLHLGGSTNKSIRVDTALSNSAFFTGWQDSAAIGVNRNPFNGAFTDTAKAASSIFLYGQASSSYITFNTTNTNNTNPTERMRIDSSGNVGIGTASPSGSLNIRSVSATGSEYNLLSQNNSGTQLFYVRNDGVVVVSNSYFYVTSSQGAYFDGSVKARGGITDDGGTLGLGGGGNTNHLNILSNGDVGIGTTVPTEKLHVNGNILVDSVLLSNQENTDVDSAAAEMVAQVAIATYTAVFFDFVIKKGTNVRSGTVYACHDGTNVEFTETSTQDLGDTSDVTLSVDISGGNIRLVATVTSNDWSIKTLVRAI